ncbi:LPXTG cell wall anchor domain-containing protein [Leucobacter chromiireducens]|uniref:LPXTG cell wall anchor domain-containing protein n=1 Tax=Leucobacter chromiireducens TaxID=283877 RepID=UPI000F631F1D|nr:LPXTG cell wall anchor domain-containing protein [Leucobacter chromiireducens]
MHARPTLARRLTQSALGVAALAGMLLVGAGTAHADTGVESVTAAAETAVGATGTASTIGIPELGSAESAVWFLAAGAVYIVSAGVLLVRKRRSAALTSAALTRA